MSVNIYDGTNLTPIAGLTVPAPTPDYVDEQFNPSTTYSLGMTCIEGNVRYRYKNSTATSGHRPPDTTYWEVYSVTDAIKSVGIYDHLKYVYVTEVNSDSNKRIDTKISVAESIYKNYTHLFILQKNGWNCWYIDMRMMIFAKSVLNMGRVYPQTNDGQWMGPGITALYSDGFWMDFYANTASSAYQIYLVKFE